MHLLDAHFLIADIASDDKNRSQEATQVIAEFDYNTDVDVSVFVNALTSQNTDVVFWSEIALEHLGERGRAAIPALMVLLNEKQLFLRQAAIKALVAVGPDDKNTKAAIFRSFADQNPFIRREALQACVGFQKLSTEELAAIAAMVNDIDETVSSWSEIALRNIRIKGNF